MIFDLFIPILEKKVKKSKNISILLLNIYKRGVYKIMLCDFRFIYSLFVGKRMNKIIHYEFRFIYLSSTEKGVKKLKSRYLITKYLQTQVKKMIHHEF